MPVTLKTFAQLALEDPEGLWELHRGVPRGKPPMTQEHNTVIRRLGAALARRLDPELYEVCTNTGRLTPPDGSSYVPDVFVLPLARKRPWADRPSTLEAYSEPMPLVVEVWSPTTGEYDVAEKTPAYQARGDLEIWRIHPYDRVGTVWRRRAAGYDGLVVTEGDLQPAPLASVRISLASLFG